MLAALPGEARRLKGLGAGAVEFWAEVVPLDERYASAAVWGEAAVILRDEGLEATVHLPLHWVDLTSLDREVWEGGLRSVEQALRVTQPLAPAMAAVHPSNYATQAALAQAPASARPAMLGALGSRLVAALARLRGGAGGEVVALENLEGMPVDLFVLVARTAGVGVCLDVGHALAEGHDPVGLLERVRDRLLGLHLHDAMPRQARPTGSAGQPQPPNGPPPEAAELAHKALGTGCLDLPALVAALGEAHFAGPVVLEVVGGPGDEERSARCFAEALNRRR